MRQWRVLVAFACLLGCSPESNAPDNAPAAVTASAPTCGEGEILDATGACRTPCTDDAQCPSDATCDTYFGLCRAAPPPPASTPGCTADDECGVGSRCDEGTCVSRLGDVLQTCTDASDCGLLMTCQYGVCFGCVDDLQCGEGKCLFGVCTAMDLGPAGDCLTLECTDGERCNPLTGTCEPTCDADEECGEAKVCAPVLHQCIDEFGCDTSEDCLTNVPMCVGGLCVGCFSDAECRASERCVSAGPAGVCLPTFEPVSACDGVTCAASETCDPVDGSCYPTNGTCADASDCRAGQSCNFLHLCSGCASDGDCRSAQRCLFGTCVPGAQ